ncbi:MAG: hypothetical protein ACPGYL_07200, partial [Rhodospirillaceae bacterium]
EDIIGQMRDGFDHAGLDAGVMVVINGSFARREASALSDVDFQIITRDRVDPDQARAIADAVWSAPGPHAGLRERGKEGAFGAVECVDDFLRNIGGQGDDNNKLTRRSLFLLEGEVLFNRALFEDLRSRLLQRYVPETVQPHELTLFLLNDFIRYWRTICVDYEFKTEEAGKQWAIRNVKLAFSRKLLYFGGLLAVAETARRIRSEKLSALTDLLALSPVERVLVVFGDAALPVLEPYEHFLTALSEADTRAHLDGLSKDKRDADAVYQRLRNDGKLFTWGLMNLFNRHYPPQHPIHESILF